MNMIKMPSNIRSRKKSLTFLLGEIFDRLTVAIFDSFSLSFTWTGDGYQYEKSILRKLHIILLNW